MTILFIITMPTWVKLPVYLVSSFILLTALISCSSLFTLLSATHNISTLNCHLPIDCRVLLSFPIPSWVHNNQDLQSSIWQLCLQSRTHSRLTGGGAVVRAVTSQQEGPGFHWVCVLSVSEWLLQGLWLLLRAQQHVHQILFHSKKSAKYCWTWMLSTVRVD